VKVDARVWKKWQDWAERIREDFGQVVEDRDVHEGFRDVVQANGTWIDENQGGLFVDFIKRSYVGNAFMGVRRQLKVDDDSISLMRLLEQMAAQAHQITFEFYLTIFPLTPDRDPDRFVWQEETFRGFTDDRVTLSTRIVNEDMRRARELAAEIEKAADRTVAHLQKGEHKSNVTFDDLRSSIDHFDKLACRYLALITGKGWSSCGAKAVFPWGQIFRHRSSNPPPSDDACRIEAIGWRLQGEGLRLFAAVLFKRRFTCLLPSRTPTTNDEVTKALGWTSIKVGKRHYLAHGTIDRVEGRRAHGRLLPAKAA